MPLPDLGDICRILDVKSQDLCIRFPGGAEVCAQIPQINAEDFDLAKQLLAQANAGIAPLTPIFNIIDTAIAILDCIKAVPDAITSLDPSKITDCIPELASKVDKLIGLLPQVSIPIFIVDIIDAIIAFLIGVKSNLSSIIDATLLVDAAQIRANELQSGPLQIVVDCARGNIDVQLTALNESLGPINRLIGVVNGLLELAGLPPLIDLEDLGEDAQEALNIMDRAIEALKTARSAIPL